MSALEAVRELRCRGCDIDGLHAPDGDSWLYEAEHPEWPLPHSRTCLHGRGDRRHHRHQRAASRSGTGQMRHRNPRASRWFGKWIEDSFSHAFAKVSDDMASIAMPTPSGRVVTASVVAHRMNVSQQLLGDC